MDYEFNSSFAEYKYAKFKKRVANDPVYPKTLSLEFAKTLIPKRGQTSHGREPTLTAEQIATMQAMRDAEAEAEGGGGGESNDGQSSLQTEFKHHTGGITPVTPKSAAGPARATMAFPPLNLSRPNSSSNLNRDGVATPLMRSASMTPGKMTRLNSMVSVRNLSVSVGAPATPAAPAAPTTPSHHQVTIASEEDFDDFSFSNSSKQDESEGMHDDSPGRHDKVDFFKICALCELRLPRSSMEIKVFRKHVVKLRSSWDPKLVSKEIRSLDNTISMYNLVDVCLFCSQYFDPDFPDGIAYPVKIQYNVNTLLMFVRFVVNNISILGEE